MKKILLLLIICLSITSIGLARVQGYVPPKDPVDLPISFSGSAKKLVSSNHGTTHTWVYYEYTRTTMEYCQNEENSYIAGFATIVEWCHPNF